MSLKCSEIGLTFLNITTFSLVFPIFVGSVDRKPIDSPALIVTSKGISFRTIIKTSMKGECTVGRLYLLTVEN